MTNPPRVPVSPTFPTPGPLDPLAELAIADPLAFYGYINQPQDTKSDYKSSKEARKRPVRSGLRNLGSI